MKYEHADTKNVDHVTVSPYSNCNFKRAQIQFPFLYPFKVTASLSARDSSL